MLQRKRTQKSPEGRNTFIAIGLTDEQAERIVNLRQYLTVREYDPRKKGVNPRGLKAAGNLSIFTYLLSQAWPEMIEPGELQDMLAARGCENVEKHIPA